MTKYGFCSKHCCLRPYSNKIHILIIEFWSCLIIVLDLLIFIPVGNFCTCCCLMLLPWNNRFVFNFLASKRFVFRGIMSRYTEHKNDNVLYFFRHFRGGSLWYRSKHLPGLNTQLTPHHQTNSSEHGKYRCLEETWVFLIINAVYIW